MRKVVRGIQTAAWEWNAAGCKCSRLSSLVCTPCERVLTKQAVASSSGTNFAGGATRRTVTQQVRKYAPVAGQVPEEKRRCWNCNQSSGRKSHMLCEACGYLQDVDAEINYFDLLNCPNSFIIENQELTRRFRELQTLVHPDKYSNKTSREQSNSADWSALINRAYKTLSTPIERGQYLLKLQGQQLPQDNSSLDKEFLMEMMERNEEVEEASTSEELQRLNERIACELNERIKELSALFEENALDSVKLLLVKMKYLLSVQKSIKNKMQLLMGS